MTLGSLLEPIPLLYSLCLLLLGGLCFIVAWKGRRPRRNRLRHIFYLLALSLLLWQFTLFIEVRTADPELQLWLGRSNFASIVFAVYFALRFVQEIPEEGLSGKIFSPSWLPFVTGAMAALTLLTPLIVTAERVEAGRAITTFGPLFPAYLLHILVCLTGALTTAFRERRRTKDPKVRGQLSLIGSGMLATGGIALVTNVLLPYGYKDFRFSDLGTLSTLIFVLAVAYATFLHGLFDLRVVLRKALVYGILLAFVLGAYASAVFLVTQYLTESSGKLVQFAVLMIAFSLDPLRRFLDEKTSRLLFGEVGDQGRGRSKGSEAQKR